MTPTIPIPTDHIYKFYALCGLAIFIASTLGAVYVSERAYERRTNSDLELEILNKKPNLSPEEEAKKVLLTEKSKIYESTDNLVGYALGGSAAVGLFVMGVGFVQWQKKVQPNQDKLLALQIKKMEREILALDKELAQTHTPPAPPVPQG
jgi:hypothetical protein